MNVLAEIRKESQSIFNRIHSIAEDAEFVRQVHDHYPHFPLVPNMRCGAWYTDPKIADTERAYFKSTDGHTNNWSFNLRRPNLHILPLIAERGGIVLVDSTRAGKRIPDALSKTVPIWCVVVNRASLKRATEHPNLWDTALYTPPGSVSPQEHSQIEDKIDQWASELAASSYQLPMLDRPLRSIWITPATTVFPTFTNVPVHRFYPIVCVCASKQVGNGTERLATGFSYIQGSGDDHELWSMGLTPVLYWQHRDRILSVASFDLPGVVQSLVSTPSPTNDAVSPAQQLYCGTPIQRVSGRVSVCSVASLRQSHSLHLYPDVAFLCLISDDLDRFIGMAGISMQEEPRRMLRIQTPSGKKGQHHFLSAVLPRSMPFVRDHLQHHRTVCIVCNTGTDTSVGVALAALALFFCPDGAFCAQGNTRDQLSKDMLKTRLQWIISSCPQANPSRTTLKRVNDFLLSPFSDPWTPGVSNHPECASVSNE